MYYTYAHYTADKSRIFYIGKGKDSRYKEKDGRSTHWKRIVAKHGLHTEILAEWPTEKEALQHEVFLISCIKEIYELCNHTIGGEGVSGLKMSDESKKKMSDAKKRIMTDEYKKKISDGTKKAMANPEVLKRMSDAMKGRKASEETKKKLSIAQKLRIRSPEIGKKISASKMGHKHSAETLEKMRLGHLGKKKQEYICPHCAKVGRGPVMYQWHFDMCRSKQWN